MIRRTLFLLFFPVAGAVAAEQQNLSVTPENVPNFGRIEGHATLGVKYCNVQVSGDFKTVFEWGRARHGKDYAKEEEAGRREMEQLYKGAGSKKFCKALLAVIGPEGSHSKNVIVPVASTSSDPPPALLELSPAELIRRTSSNELKLRKELGESGRFIIKGKVESVEAGYFFSGPMITFAAGGMFKSVITYMNSSQKNWAEELDKGQVVSVICERPTKIIQDHSAAGYDCDAQQ